MSQGFLTMDPKKWFIKSTSSMLSMPSTKPLAAFAFASMAFVLCMLTGCTEKTAKANTQAKRPPTPVKIAEVTEEAMPVQVTAIGCVEAYSTIQVKALVSGELTSVEFNEGDIVKQGQILFMIDARPYEVALHQAEANLSKAEAQADQAKAMTNKDRVQAVNARTMLSRDDDLIKKGFVSKEEYDTAKTNADTLDAAVGADDANYKSAVEAVHVAKVAIEDAKLQLSYCTIRSPIEGKTGSLLVHKGNLVKANDTISLVVINQMRPIYGTFMVTDKYLSAIKKYMAQGPLEVKALIPQEDQPAVGQLTFIDNAVSQNTGTIKLKATFANEDDRLWPGQFVNLALRMTVVSDAVVAPASAIQTSQEGQFAYVITPDMTAEMRKVKVGATQNGRTVVTEGLQPQEKVVTDGQLQLTQGAPVKLAESASSAGSPAPGPSEGTAGPASGSGQKPRKDPKQ